MLYGVRAMALKSLKPTALLDQAIGSLTHGPEGLALSLPELEKAYRVTREGRSRRLSSKEIHELSCLGQYLKEQRAHCAATVVFSFLRQRALPSLRQRARS
jgi:hypothetical protein